LFGLRSLESLPRAGELRRGAGVMSMQDEMSRLAVQPGATAGLDREKEEESHVTATIFPPVSPDELLERSLGQPVSAAPRCAEDEGDDPDELDEYEDDDEDFDDDDFDDEDFDEDEEVDEDEDLDEDFEDDEWEEVDDDEEFEDEDDDDDEDWDDDDDEDDEDDEEDEGDWK
jgi:hypothetical protein